MDTAARIWEGDSVQLATKEVSLTLIHWMHRAGRIPGQQSWRVNFTDWVVSTVAILRQASWASGASHSMKIASVHKSLISRIQTRHFHGLIRSLSCERKRSGYVGVCVVLSRMKKVPNGRIFGCAG